MQISGLDTNVNFLIDLALHPSFQSGDVHTGFIDQHFDSLFPPIEVSNQTMSQAVAAFVTTERLTAFNLAVKQGIADNPFAINDGFRINGFRYVRDMKLESNGKIFDIKLKYVDLDYEIKINDSEWKPLTVKPVKEANPNRFTLKINLGGEQSTFSAFVTKSTIDVFNEVSQN